MIWKFYLKLIIIKIVKMYNKIIKNIYKYNKDKYLDKIKNFKKPTILFI